MPPRKRARASSAGGSSAPATPVTTIKLSGGSKLSPGVLELWRSGQLNDTVVTVEGRSFDAVKYVLASGSDYFRRHFTNEQMARGATNPTLQEHVSAAAFEPLLNFLYEGECSIDETKLTEVLQAASFLTVKPLEHAAVAALQERLSPSNALAAWSLADQLSLPELAEAAKVTALKGFDELEKIEEAILEHVQALVADDRLQAKNEEAVFSAVARFAEAKQPAEADLFGLLRHVRFPLMSKEFVLGTARTWPMLDTKAGAHLLLESMASPLGSRAQQPRRGFGDRFLYVMGGETDYDNPILSLEIYDSHTHTWVKGSLIPRPILQAAAAVLDGKIYVLGGTESGDGSTAVSAFDPRTGVWQHMPSMGSAGHDLAAVAVGGKLYAIGGSDETYLDNMEVFDPQTGRWAPAPAMQTARDMPKAAVLSGKIYVLDGEHADDEAPVEVYDPATETWAEAPALPTARRGFEVAAFDGKLYVAGGWTRSHGLVSCTTVDVFDPQTNSWASVAPMTTARYDLSLTVARGKLYAVGGAGSRGEPHATAESYDPQQDRWEAVAPLNLTRSGHVAVAI